MNNDGHIILPSAYEKKIYGGLTYVNATVHENNYSTPEEFVLAKAYGIEFEQHEYEVHYAESRSVGKIDADGKGYNHCTKQVWEYGGSYTAYTEFPRKSYSKSIVGCWRCAGEGRYRNCECSDSNVEQCDHEYFSDVSFVPAMNVYMWGASPNVKYILGVRIVTYDAFIDKEDGYSVRRAKATELQDFQFEFTIPSAGFKETKRVVDGEGNVLYENPCKVRFELNGNYNGWWHTAGDYVLYEKGAENPPLFPPKETLEDYPIF